MASWPYNGPRWKAARLFALARDGYTCTVRGDGPHSRYPYLDVDHIEPWTQRPDLMFELDNLRTVCRLHHNRKTHGKPKRRRNSRRW